MIPVSAVSIIVDWYGPFEKKVAAGQAQRWGDGEKLLYMALGSHNICRYVGRTTAKNLRQRLSGHDQVKGDDDLYIGRVATSGIPGPNPGVVPRDLRDAEHALVFALQPERNEQLKANPPYDCVVVYSRTFNDPWEEARTTPPPKFPTLVICDPSLSQSVRLKKGPL